MPRYTEVFAKLFSKSGRFNFYNNFKGYFTMNTKQNLHTHTVFCDGRNTPEELIYTAIDKGFGSLGFSMHCDPTVNGRNPDFPEKFQAYKAEILRLKAEWHGKFPIFLGVEYDAYADQREFIRDCDYRIGSVHYLKWGGDGTEIEEGSLVKMDLRQPSMVSECIEAYFGGDFLKFAESYYRSLAELPLYGDFDIIGHFDLLTKHAASFPEWETDSSEYRKLAEGAISALKGRIPFFEINSGAIGRGYRKEPYPDKYILKKLRENGFGAVISSDCHNKDYLDVAFEDCRNRLAEAGFSSRFILTENGFIEVGV
jgi:histidinol-phosphatase (PHP family)